MVTTQPGSAAPYGKQPRHNQYKITKLRCSFHHEACFPERVCFSRPCEKCGARMSGWQTVRRTTRLYSKGCDVLVTHSKCLLLCEYRRKPVPARVIGSFNLGLDSRRRTRRREHTRELGRSSRAFPHEAGAYGRMRHQCMLPCLIEPYRYLLNLIDWKRGTPAACISDSETAGHRLPLYINA